MKNILNVMKFLVLATSLCSTLAKADIWEAENVRNINLGPTSDLDASNNSSVGVPKDPNNPYSRIIYTYFQKINLPPGRYWYFARVKKYAFRGQGGWFRPIVHPTPNPHNRMLDGQYYVDTDDYIWAYMGLIDNPIQQSVIVGDDSDRGLMVDKIAITPEGIDPQDQYVGASRLYAFGTGALEGGNDQDGQILNFQIGGNGKFAGGVANEYFYGAMGKFSIVKIAPNLYHAYFRRQDVHPDTLPANQKVDGYRIYKAVSTDGLNFVVDPTPVIPVGPGTQYDFKTTYDPSITRLNGEYVMTFEAVRYSNPAFSSYLAYYNKLTNNWDVNTTPLVQGSTLVGEKGAPSSGATPTVYYKREQSYGNNIAYTAQWSNYGYNEAQQFGSAFWREQDYINIWPNSSIPADGGVALPVEGRTTGAYGTAEVFYENGAYYAIPSTGTIYDCKGDWYLRMAKRKLWEDNWNWEWRISPWFKKDADQVVQRGRGCSIQYASLLNTETGLYLYYWESYLPPYTDPMKPVATYIRRKRVITN